MKIHLSLVAFAFISTACGSNHGKKGPEVPEAVDNIDQTSDDPSKATTNTATDASVKPLKQIGSKADNKAEINGKTMATCTVSRGPFVVCESDKSEVLQSVSIERDYADLVGEQVEVQVSFEGTIKAAEAFSIEANKLAIAEIPDGNNPVLKLTFNAPAQIDLSVSSVLEKNPQLMDLDFGADLKAMKVVILPGPLTQINWVNEGKQQLFRLNNLDAFVKSEVVEKSMALIAKIERYQVQDAEAVRETYQLLKAALTAQN